MNVRAQLVPLNAGAEPVDIVKDVTLVGRKEDCDLRLDHKSVSKLHCIIVKTDGLLLVRDLGSTNGTRVNDQRVRRAALLPNDKLSVAQFQFRVRLGPDVELSAAPEDHTVAIDGAEAQDMLEARSGKQAASDADVQLPPVPIKANVLPDMYPADEKKKAK